MIGNAVEGILLVLCLLVIVGEGLVMGFMVSGFGGGFFLVVINDVEQLGVGFAIYFSPDDQGVNHFLLPHLLVDVHELVVFVELYVVLFLLQFEFEHLIGELSGLYFHEFLQIDASNVV